MQGIFSIEGLFKIKVGFQERVKLLKPHFDFERQHSAYGNNHKTPVNHKQS